ncbi:MAG: GNAT family N-acetyltransferase [Prevotella sp.]|nr:GNAT family N-acetyltransferase [Prevotella sp.]
MTSVRLRAIEPEDLELLYTIENDPSLWHVGSATVPYSRYAINDFILHATGDIFADRQVRLMVEAGDLGVVGMADLTSFEPLHMRAEVGIVILQQYRHCGYATEALRQLCIYATERLHLHQLYAVVNVENRFAEEAFVSSGFQKTATLRQWIFDGTSYQDAHLLQTFL